MIFGIVLGIVSPTITNQRICGCSLSRNNLFIFDEIKEEIENTGCILPLSLPKQSHILPPNKECTDFLNIYFWLSFVLAHQLLYKRKISENCNIKWNGTSEKEMFKKKFKWRYPAELHWQKLWLKCQLVINNQELYVKLCIIKVKTSIFQCFFKQKAKLDQIHRIKNVQN